MSIVVQLNKNPDNSWTATGGSSLVVVSVTCLTREKAVTNIDAALSGIAQKRKS